MIQSIRIAAGTASFETETVVESMTPVSFFFGANGTGKTSISRIINDPVAHAGCVVGWKNGAQLPTMVYNRDFVIRNFEQLENVPGVFTLGEENIETHKKIEAAKSDRAQIESEIAALRTAQDLKKEELIQLEEGIRAKCWDQKVKHDAALRGGFEGYRNNVKNFTDKVLSESGTNTATVTPLADLARRAEAMYGKTPASLPPIAPIDASALLSFENDPILLKVVIGKHDVDIAALIEKLGASDWVRAGRPYFEAAGGLCPFCQREAPATLAQSLEEYFDDAFVQDTERIATNGANYSTEAGRLRGQLAGLIASGHKFLDVQKLTSELDLLDARVSAAKGRLEEKRKEPSRPIELDSVSNVLDAVNGIVNAANAEITAHNAMVANLAKERADLTAEIWRFVLEELKADLAAYKSTKAGCLKGITTIDGKLEAAGKKLIAKQEEIASLEKATTSVQPTIDAINHVLQQFGFEAFQLAQVGEGPHYKLIRSDGSEAKHTLSEGERSFVAFLYFFNLLRGSEHQTGTASDRVAVFDDPVSSLDSDILFVVSSLIKGIFEEVRSGSGLIKQAIVLTHNVYFHKEVTHRGRAKGKDNNEAYFVVRKIGSNSQVQRHAANPVRSSYDMLWDDVRKPDARPPIAVQNALRRIVETYFVVLGGLKDIDSVCNQFKGTDRVICRSLFSWMHDGSHYAQDDLYVSVDSTAMERYLIVFRMIFEKTGQLPHYEMMMQDGPAAIVQPAAPGAETNTPA